MKYFKKFTFNQFTKLSLNRQLYMGRPILIRWLDTNLS